MQQRESPGAASPGCASPEARLPHRKGDVADDPQLQSWSSTDYAASLAAKAQQRAARFEKAAAALPPYASDAGALTRAASTSSTSSVGQFHLPSHQALPPAGKVNSTVIDAGAYSAALQESTLARQRARQVLAGPAPFAVQPGEGGAAAAPPAEAYHYRRPGEVQPPAKVGSRSPEARVAGHKPASLSPKVTASEWDQQRMEEDGRQRVAAQEATRRRSWGTPGLLG